MKKVTLKIMLLLGLALTNAFSMDITEAKMNEMRHLIQEQDIVADAAEKYLEKRGVVPTGIAALVGEGLLPDTYSASFTGAYSISVAGMKIQVQTTYAGAEPYQVDLYLNPLSRKKTGIPAVVGTSFNCDYTLGTDAISSYQMAQAGVSVSPTAPGGVAGAYWYNSRSKILYFYNTSWTTLNVKRLWIVRNLVELPSVGAAGDGAIVLTTTSLAKYLYVNGSWALIPQAIAFSYNGAF